jgi:hypothetical protein
MQILKLNSKSILQLTLKASYLAALGFLILDAMLYFGSVQKNFKLSPIAIAAVLLVFHGLIRFYKKQKLTDEFVRVNLFFLAPIALFLGLAAYFLEEYGFLFPNYFFINFKIHYISLPFLAIPAIAFGLLHASREFMLRTWRSLFFLLILIIIIGTGVIYAVDPIYYTQITSEDNLVENLTSIFFAIGSVFALLLVKKRRYFQSKVVRSLFTTGCILVATGLLFVAGEEISWGQRIFDFQTSDSVAATNLQGEINLHNSELLFPFVYSTYAFVGFYGGFLWLIEWALRDIISIKKTLLVWKKILIPGGYLFLNFGLVLIYLWLRKQHGLWKYQSWEEFSELILVIGIVVHLAEVYLSFPSLKSAISHKTQK